MDKQEWFEKNGFNAEGDTYIIVGIDTYAIKNELKAAGWKYNSWLRWHGPDPSAFPNNVHKLHWDKAYSFTAWGEALPLPGIQKQIDNLIKEMKPISTSEWIGEAGDHINHLLVTLVSIQPFIGKYGYNQVVKFKTDAGDALTWFTKTEIKIIPGNKCYLSGNIKKLDEYKDEKVTILTRCKLKAE